MAANDTPSSRDNARDTTSRDPNRDVNRDNSRNVNRDTNRDTNTATPRSAVTDRTQHDRERSIEVGRDAGRDAGRGSDVSRRIGNFWRDLWSDRANFGQSGWAPQIETFRRGDSLVIRADLPGLTKEDVNVEVDDGVLTISGERCEDHTDEQDGFYRTERSYGEFFRSLPLPEGVSDAQCDATFKDGVLEVTFPVPKQRERNAKRVKVR